jgi:hypothetical protein
LPDYSPRLAYDFNGFDHFQRRIGHEHHIVCFDGGIRAQRPHGDAHIGLGNDRRIVDAVTPTFSRRYLPVQPEGSAEIARTSLASVTSNQMVVYARKTSRNIRHSIVDEYDSLISKPYHLQKDPLSLGELIRLIDGSASPGGIGTGGMVFRHLDANYDGHEEDLKGLVKVVSAFYPDLRPYYEAMIDAWLEDRRQGKNGGRLG